MSEHDASPKQDTTRAELPYLTAALLCQNVLQEVDGVVSLIRIVDRFTFEVPEDAPADALLEGDLAIFVAFKSGSFRGTLPIEITQHGPQGGKQTILKVDVMFTDETQGPQIVSRLRFIAPIAGTYWFDISLGDRLVSRTPMIVEIYRRGISK